MGCRSKDNSVADIGTGDGILAAGLCTLAHPDVLVGYDVEPVDVADLKGELAARGLGDLPPTLRFDVSFPDRVPAATGAFDYVISWSVFEHVSEPLAMASEIRRLLAPGGLAMIQLFPFYLSEHGDHGWSRPSFEHLLTHEDGTELYLNKITLDQLHQTLRSAGLCTSKVELIHHGFHLPPELDTLRLSDLAIGGIKLLAVPV